MSDSSYLGGSMGLALWQLDDASDSPITKAYSGHGESAHYRLNNPAGYAHADCRSANQAGYKLARWRSRFH
jgi:hypothetical protein